MDDDFNTPEAMAALFDLAREVNRCREKSIEQAAPLGCLLKQLSNVLGLLTCEAEAFLQNTQQGDADGADTAEIEALVNARDAARDAKDWAKADQLRDQLTEKGILLEDTANGTLWRRG